jgi:hypothetical protein
VLSRYLNTGSVALASPPGVTPASRSSIFPSIPGVTGTESVPAVLARRPSLDSFEGGRVGGSTCAPREYLRLYDLVKRVRTKEPARAAQPTIQHVYNGSAGVVTVVYGAQMGELRRVGVK